MKAAIFLDRDGILSKVVFRDGQPSSARIPNEFCIIENSKSVVQQLSAAGFLIFVVTNQPDIARKKMTLSDLHEMHGRLTDFLGGHNGVRHIYVCPHDNCDQCDCRKPKPGMLCQAAREWSIDLAQSFIVGDRFADMEAGRQAGCTTILLKSTYNGGVQADFQITRIEEILPVILRLASHPKTS